MNNGGDVLAKVSAKHPPYVWNGIDRVDNSKGYTMKNCVPCDGVVNKAKLCMSKDEFLEMCKAVSNHKTQENSEWSEIH